jgi:tetratricopeptide (TPR) repeat protein
MEQTATGTPANISGVPNEVIAVIFSSWPFWVCLTVCVSFFIFKKPLGSFIYRLNHVKKGKDGDWDFEAPTPENNPTEKEKKEEEVSDKENKEEVSDKEKKEEFTPETLEDWQTEMYLAYIDRETERLKKAYEKMQELTSERISKKENTALYLELLHELGDTSALPELKKMLADHEVAFKVNITIGDCYVSSGDYDTAFPFFKKANEVAITDKEKALCIRHYASAKYYNGQKTEAISLLIGVFSILMEDKSRVEICEELADIYEKEEDYENRAFIIEKALEIKPNDPDLLFKAGYSYSQSKYEELSLLHYKNAKRINPKNENVLNNLGVQYDGLKMPISSIENYKEAEKLNETLASANLAYRLMNAGFIEEAEEKLNEAKNKENPHPNVSAALSDISKRKEAEETLEKQHVKKALSMRKFVVGFATAKFTVGNTLKLISGEWKSTSKGSVYQFKIEDNKISAFWKEKLFSFEYERKLEGEIFNNSAIFILYENKYNISKNEYAYEKNGDGFLFCSADGRTVKIMEKRDVFETRTIHILEKK